MKSTNRPNTQTFDPPKATRASRAECDEPGFKAVIELDESELAQVAGGVSHAGGVEHADFSVMKLLDAATP